MVDTQSLPEKSQRREEKLFFWGLGTLRRRGRGGFGEFNAPDIFLGLQDGADLVGFGRADVADPHDAEAGFAPAAADFDGLAGRG